jgi:hypothetical protein
MKSFLTYSASISALFLLTACPSRHSDTSLNDDSSQPGSILKKELLLKSTAQLDTFTAFTNQKVFSQSNNGSEDLSMIVPSKREDLEDLKRVVKMYNGSDNAGLNVPGFGSLKLGKDETNVNIYYLESKIVKSANDTLVYGIGYSVHYLYKRIKGGVDVSNLANVAASVQLDSKRTSVFYAMQTYGIAGTPVVRYFNPGDGSKAFDVDGFGTVQTSLNGIHNILADSLLSKHVKFTPRLLKNIRPYELEEISSKGH